jgi:PKD repeat protein
MKRNKLLLICLLAIFLAPIGKSLAQEKSENGFVNCSNYDDLIIKKKLAEDQTLYTKYRVYEDNLKMLIDNSANYKTDTLINGRRIVPVVFHIIHKGGPENISKAQIDSAIKLLTIDYNKLNSDTTAAYSNPIFAPRRANCNVEFRLANIDPYGNCTDGVVRHYDPQTNYAYFSTMTQYCWKPSCYLNVFSVSSIYPEGMSLPDGAFIGGMSPFPPSNALSQALTGGDSLADGLLMRHDGIGNIGTALNMGGMPINSLNRTMTHESGHYFNLYHPFQVTYGAILGYDGCGPTWIGCGDEVADTPPVKKASQNTALNCLPVDGSINSCSNDSPNEPDMVENYMDYQFGYCTNIFTTGQYSRINATLQGDRRKLWSKENLIATGVLTPVQNACAPKADFLQQSNSVCAGGSLHFFDNSFNGVVQTYSWFFEGGTPQTSGDANPTVIYDTPGLYKVRLTVLNSNGQDSVVKQNAVLVRDPSITISTPYTETFENVVPSDWVIGNDAGNTWEINDTTAFAGTKCMRIMNFAGNRAGGYDEFITPAYDFTTLTPGLPLYLKFMLSYAPKFVAATITAAEDTVYDELKVYYSDNCGATWIEKMALKKAALATAPPNQNSFVPSASSEWVEKSKVFVPSFQSQSHAMFKFVFKSNGGNNIFIDNIRIINNTSGIEEISSKIFDLSIKPNPVSDISIINFGLEKACKVEIKIIDVLGRKIKTIVNDYLSEGNHTFNINHCDFSARGVYFVRINSNSEIITRKIVVE